MSELLAFLQLGFQHITDPRGLDHVLFVVVLAAIYRVHDWRALIGVVTAFTVGHSITLALAALGILNLPTALIEFLIPVTIVAMGVENLIATRREGALRRPRHRPLFAALFGLVHGAGFANYLRSLFVDRVAVPLLGFNLGIELGQIGVLLLAGVAIMGMDRAFAAVRAPGVALSPYRMRVVAISGVVSVVAAAWAVERAPW